MNEPNSKSLQEMRLLKKSLEIGLVDNKLLRSFLYTLKASPEVFLPNALGEICWTAFLLYKTDLMDSAKRVAFTVLTWMLRNSDDVKLVQSCTRNVQYLFAKEGRQISLEEIKRIALEGKYDYPESSSIIEPSA